MSTDSNTPHTALQRHLSSSQISMIALSGALGTGLFLGAGSTISYAGPSIIISYALAGFLALAVVWALAELVSAHPVPGGHGAIANKYLGKFGGYITRWNYTITLLTAVGAEVTASATYLQYWFPNLHLGVGTVLCSLFIIVLNLTSVRFYGSSEYWFSLIKVTAIVVFILLGLSLILFGFPGNQPAIGFANFTSHQGFAPYGITGIFLAICMAVFSFGGVESVSVTAAESENPQRDIPRAAKTMIWRLFIFYIAALAVIIALQPWTQTVANAGQAAASPFVKVLDTVNIPGTGHVMNAVLIIAALSAANGCLYAASRMVHSLSLDGMAPRFAARTSASGTPRYAVMLCALCFFVASAIAIWNPGNAFMSLYGCATVGVLVTWALIMLTHLRFRKIHQQSGLPTPPARMWGWPVVNIVVIISTLAIFIALRTLLPVTWSAGIPYLILLFASYAVLAKVKQLPNAELTTH